MSGEIATLVEDALACVAAEHPQAYSALERTLGPRRLDLEIDDEAFMLDLGEPSARASVVSIRTGLATLDALVHGEVGVLDAVLSDRLEVIGSPDDLVAIADAMTWFVQGAVRCVSMPALLERLVAFRKE